MTQTLHTVPGRVVQTLAQPCPAAGRLSLSPTSIPRAGGVSFLSETPTPWGLML